MPPSSHTLKLIFQSEGGSDEYIESELQKLVEQLDELGAIDISRSRVGDAPTGTRGDGAVEVGALIIALGGAGATLPSLIQLLQHWLHRRKSGVIHIKIGDDEIVMTESSDPMRRQALDAFLRRHQD